MRIRHKRGFLQLEARFFGSKMRFLLDPTDDQWATRLGIGRSQNESIRFLTDENGQETLYFSGFLLRKK